MLFTDTESLTYEIKSKNVYEEFLKWKDLLVIIQSNKIVIGKIANKKVIGKMKDEFGGVIITEFV